MQKRLSINYIMLGINKLILLCFLISPSLTYAQSYCDEIVAASNANSSITVSNLNAPHHIVKIYNQNWSLTSQCTDGECSDPQTFDNLEEGTYHIIVNNYNANWGAICNFTKDVDVIGNPTGNYCDEVEAASNANSSITVSNINAPHHIVKIYNQNWSLISQCTDGDCSDPQTFDNLEGGTYHIIVNNYDANWGAICNFTQDVEVTGSPTGNYCDEIEAASNANSSITVTNLNAPHHILKVYNQNWSLVLECKDDECNDPQTIGNLAEGTYHIIVDNYTANWQSICVFTQDVDVSGGADDIDFSCATSSYGPYSNEQFSNEIQFENFGAEGCSVSAGSEEFTIGFSDDLYGTVNKRKVALSLNSDGSFVSLNENIQSPTAPETSPYTTTVNGNSLDVSYSNNGVNWTQNVEFNLPTGYEYMFNAMSNNQIKYEKGNSVFLLGNLTVKVAGSVSNVRFLPYAVRLTNTGQAGAVDYSTAIIPGNWAISEIQSVVDGIIFRGFTGDKISLYKINNSGQFAWENTLANGDLPSTNIITVTVNPDGESIYTVVNRDGISGIVQTDASTGSSLFSKSFYTYPTNGATIRFGNFSGIGFTADNDAIISFTDAEGGGNNSLYNYMKVNSAGDLIWERTSTSTTNFIPLGESPCGDKLIFVSVDSDTRMISVMKTDLDGTPDCNVTNNEQTNLPCDINAEIGNGKMTISGAGLNAAHVIVKLFSPSWSTLHTCLDNCGDQIIVDLTENGTYHLSVSLYDSNWSLTCNFLEDVSVGTANINSSNITGKMIDQYRNIVLNNIYPVPASDVINVEINSLEDSELVARLIDSRGALVGVKTIALSAGNNTYTWNIDDLPSGFYQVLFESNNRHAPIRFIKQRL